MLNTRKFAPLYSRRGGHGGGRNGTAQQKATEINQNIWHELYGKNDRLLTFIAIQQLETAMTFTQTSIQDIGLLCWGTQKRKNSLNEKKRLKTHLKWLEDKLSNAQYIQSLLRDHTTIQGAVDKIQEVIYELNQMDQNASCSKNNLNDIRAILNNHVDENNFLCGRAAKIFSSIVLHKNCCLP